MHDYHLYLVPALVREMRPDARIAFFVHIPWVGPDDWAVLPPRSCRAIHEGLLACDSVGFHTERWRQRVRRVLRGASSAAATDAERVSHANPIAVDTAEFDALATSDGVRARRAELQEDRPEILVLRVDRTDPSKNAVRGFEAFGRLLEREPGAPRPVALLALLDPSRQEIPEYVDYRGATEAAAAAVNGALRRGRTGSRSGSTSETTSSASVAAYIEYDVLLINPVMDGLNLVAKEAPLVNGRERRARPLATGGRVRGARRVGDRRRSAGRRRPGRRARAGDRASGRRAARPARGDPERASASMTSSSWADRELEELEARAPG